MTEKPIRIAALCGSLRKASFNRMALNAVVAKAPTHGLEIVEAPIAGLPVFDSDLAAEGRPEAVAQLAETLTNADGILIVSPEYNYSVPGGLKNAIDWASRAQPNPFAGKGVAILGVSAGRLGTARMQYHLRQILVFLDAHPLNKPEVMIGNAGGTFDANGALVDTKVDEMLDRQLEALATWVKRLSS